MKNRQELFEQLATFLYKLEELQYIHSNESCFLPKTPFYAMLLVLEANGEITINGRNHLMHKRKIFLISPHATVHLRLHPACPGESFLIRFQALQADAQGFFAPARLDCPEELFAPHFLFLIEKVRQMEKKLQSGNGWDAMRANLLLQEMLYDLFRETIRGQKPEIRQAIAITLDYMEQNYPSRITREQLAEMAGMNPDYFARAFKKQIGKSPMEYLTCIRIEKAKQLLLHSGESIRSVAQRVGFGDEFYFSRKFKAVTGLSPTSYKTAIEHSGESGSGNPEGRPENRAFD